MRKRIISTLLVSFLLFSLSGCWDAKEINDMGLVLSVALDKTGNQYKVTAQIAKPETYSKTASGSTKNENEKPFWIISATGETIFEAVRNMSSISPRNIFWAHIKVILIGEELAKSDIRDLLDFFIRNPELSLRSLVVATSGEAGKLLEIPPMMEKDPATNLEMVINNNKLIGKGYKNMLKNLLEEYLEPKGNLVISKITVNQEEEKPTLALSGSAYFNKSKMVGWLESNETRGLFWLKNEIRNTVMVIHCPYDNEPITIELKKEKLSIKSGVENEIPYYNIKVKATGNVVEQQCVTEFNNPNALKELEETLSAAIQEDINSTIKKAQNSKVDFIGFNNILHGQRKKDWRQLSENWEEIFPQANVTVDVEANIPSISLLARPLTPVENNH